MELAQETVAICEAGSYLAPNGKRIDIAADLSRAKDQTVLYTPENPPRLPAIASIPGTTFEVVNETTFSALKRLDGLGGHLGCLNFSSAKNPGGGFLNGAQAQEESLARASGLYPCLLTAPEFYERNRANRSLIYLDLLIYSPLVPFFRNDDGALLERPVMASIITAPAPNAGAVMQNEPENAQAIEPALRRRAELVLQVAAAHQIERLVLGAWGCGVFRNDPANVARTFADLLQPAGKFAGVFRQIVFAVYDPSDSQATYRAFAEVFNGNVG